MVAYLTNILNHNIWRTFLRRYELIFSVHEIGVNKVLQLVFGATILSYLVAFNAWIFNPALTLEAVKSSTHICWPYLQPCGSWYFLQMLPEGHSQAALYMFLLGSLVVSAFFVFKREWGLAHAALLPSFIWHSLGSFVISYALAGNYDYYLFLFACVLLFLPHKEFFLKAVLALTYFLSSVPKIHESWILGTYFSALETGLPLFPKWSIPLWTNLVIFMEVVGVWFLFSERKILQRSAFIFFVAFHLYSGLFVGYRFPVTVLPTLIILFGSLYRHSDVPFGRKSLMGWILVVLLFAMQFSPKFILGDEKITMEGARFGFYMFDTNHQCVTSGRYVFVDGTTREFRAESYSARSRCESYRYWFRLDQTCKRNPRIASVVWTFDHSINGGPFLRIVDVPDACALTYNVFSHNAWIKTEHDNPPVVGYPLENVYE